MFYWCVKDITCSSTRARYTNVFTFSVTVGCLILHQRYKKRFERYLSLANDVSSTFQHENFNEDDNASLIQTPSTATSSFNYNNRNHTCGGLPTINEGCCEESPVLDIEDLLTVRKVSKELTVADGNA